MRIGNRILRIVTELLITATALLSISVCALASGGTDNNAQNSPAGSETLMGGGYAVTGRIPNVSYTSEIYDALNGLPTSDANFILGARDGYVWIGSYSGIMRYDGQTFERLDTSDGLTSGRVIFEDSTGRIWIGTNDNGVVVIDGNKSIHYTYKDGLSSSSIRIFAEDNKGNVFIGTTAGVCYVSPDMSLHVVNDERINEERVLKLDSDRNGRIYGQTKEGILFSIDDGAVSEVYKSTELGMEKATTILADPVHAGRLYIGTEGEAIYHGSFGESAENMERIDVSPVSNTHWLSYDCGKVWISSTTAVGYLDGSNGFHEVSDLPINSGIEMTTSDYQGNLWVASTTQGVMKVVTNSFVDITKKAGLPETVANSACMHQGDLYVGSDHGIYVISGSGAVSENALTDYVGDARVRCIREDEDGNIWCAVYNNELGLVCMTADGKIRGYTTEDGMPGNEIRCISVSRDGSVLVGTSEGIAILKDGMVIDKADASSGMKNTVILTVTEGDNGEVLAGSDGDGIYVIKDGNISRIGRDEGLTSDVIIKIIKDYERGVYWIVTSNSIEYMKNGEIHEVTTFPYNNNYDISFDSHNDMWIISSYGIYKVNADDMINDSITDYKLYTIANGLPFTPTSNSFGTKDTDGYLYIPGRNGVCRVNIDTFLDEEAGVRVSLSSIYCDDERILPENGVYTIPPSQGRISIKPAVLDYTLMNPLVKVYLEGMEEDGITVKRNELTPLEYTGLKYGDYVLHIQVLDAVGKKPLTDRTFEIVKKPLVRELPWFRLLLLCVVASAAGYIVWQVLKSTVIRSQYDEIKQAKEEAERANSAKTRFLANISHEIRTPISTIMGMNEMVMREDATGVPKPYFMSMMNYAFDIRNASEALLSLINDLLDMSKIESGKMHLVEQEYDTQELLRSVVSMIRMRATEKGLTFDAVIDEVLPSRLYGDAGKIKQIILNLLSNAVKYTDVGGFALCVYMTERKDDDCQIRFSVKDTGMGIKEEDMDKLFTAYERLDEEKNSGVQGTGLGLDISRRFAELMGGSLTCESVYGKGSEFILTLHQRITDKTPIGVFMEDSGKTKGPYVPKFIAPAADILVVDDTPMNLNVIKGLLKPTKVYVTTATNGEECLELIKDTRFNVVLLDHMMPGMDGVETVERIRRTDTELPVYALTANTALGEAFYISKGFNGYLTKPVDSETLEKTIMKHIPEEMMEKAGDEDIREQLTELPENMKWVYDTEGISVDEGISNSGGIESYIFSLNLFLDTIDNNAKVIRDSYESDNLRLFTIKVHALKSSARIIGAHKLAAKAAQMEEAGNREDRAYISQNTYMLLAEYEEFKEKLARLHEHEENGSEKDMIPEQELRDAYMALADVIPQMDYDSVEMILESLKEYSLPREAAIKVKDLGKMLRIFDWDGMEALIEEMVQQDGGN